MWFTTGIPCHLPACGTICSTTYLRIKKWQPVRYWKRLFHPFCCALGLLKYFKPTNEQDSSRTRLPFLSTLIPPEQQPPEISARQLQWCSNNLFWKPLTQPMCAKQSQRSMAAQHMHTIVIPGSHITIIYPSVSPSMRNNSLNAVYYCQLLLFHFYHLHDPAFLLPLLFPPCTTI